VTPARKLVHALAFQLSRPGMLQLAHAQPSRFALLDAERFVLLEDVDSVEPRDLGPAIQRAAAKLPRRKVIFCLCRSTPGGPAWRAAVRAATSEGWFRKKKIRCIALEGRGEVEEGTVQPGGWLQAALEGYRAGARAPARWSWAPTEAGEVGESEGARAPRWVQEGLQRTQDQEAEDREKVARLFNGRRVVVPALVAACLLVFGCMIWASGSFFRWRSVTHGAPIPTLVAFGALVRNLVYGGEWWRLLTGTFVHMGVLHIGFNLYALWAIGGPYERLVGPWRLLLVYVLSGLGASLASLASHAGVSAGASGAIFGVFGLHAAVAWRPRGLLPKAVARKLLRSVFTLLALNALIGLSVPQIDNAAHVGGLVTGFVLGLVLPLDPERPPAWVRPAGLASGLLLAAAFGICLVRGAQHLRGRDLGAPTRVVAGPVQLEVPARLAQGAERHTGYVLLQSVEAAIDVVVAWKPGAPEGLRRFSTQGWRRSSFEQNGVPFSVRVRRGRLPGGQELEIALRVVPGFEHRYAARLDAIARSITPLTSGDPDRNDGRP